MPDSIEDMLFMQSACDYYVAARFAMHAQSVPLVGILFHHAVERFLKAGLAQKRQLSELKDIGHDLKKLWRTFKEDFPSADLTGHDKTISSINKGRPLRGWDRQVWDGDNGSVVWSRG
jgi:hypothetical protein